MPSEMEDRGDVAMAELGRAAGFAEEALLSGGVIEITGADHLQRNVAAEIGVERLVSNAHRPAAELDC